MKTPAKLKPSEMTPEARATEVVRSAEELARQEFGLLDIEENRNALLAFVVEWCPDGKTWSLSMITNNTLLTAFREHGYTPQLLALVRRYIEGLEAHIFSLRRTPN